MVVVPIPGQPDFNISIQSVDPRFEAEAASKKRH